MVFFDDIDEVGSLNSIVIQNLSLFEHIQQVGNSQSAVFLQGVLGLAAAKVLEDSYELRVLSHDGFGELEGFLLIAGLGLGFTGIW